MLTDAELGRSRRTHGCWSSSPVVPVVRDDAGVAGGRVIVLDIDDTISPTRPTQEWAEPHEMHHCGAFPISIPTFILTALRCRDDVVLLSTWDANAAWVAEHFGFTAEVWVMPPTTAGIEGKFAQVQAHADHVAAWADDHLTPRMRAWARQAGITTVRPTQGHLTRRNLTALTRAADLA